MGFCIRLVSILALSLVFGLSAGAPEKRAYAADEGQQLKGTIVDPWIRLPAVSGRPAAGYVRIISKSPFDGYLAKAESEQIDRLEIHQSSEENGVARMRHVDRAIVPEGGELVLAPGGYHLMLMGLEEGISPGDEVIIRLHLMGQADNPKIVAIPFRARAFGDGPPK